MSSTETPNIPLRIQAELDANTISEIEKAHFERGHSYQRFQFAKRTALEVLLSACTENSQHVHDRLVKLFEKLTSASEDEINELSRQNFGRPLLRRLQVQNRTEVSVCLRSMYLITHEAHEGQGQVQNEAQEEQGQVQNEVQGEQGQEKNEAQEEQGQEKNEAQEEQGQVQNEAQEEQRQEKNEAQEEQGQEKNEAQEEQGQVQNEAQEEQGQVQTEAQEEQLQKLEGNVDAQAEQFHSCCSTILEVPKCHKKCSVLALLYLIISDLSEAFLRSKYTLAVEIPCFLEMFENSSKNNQNNLDAILGEFFALCRLCFHKEYSSDEQFYYSCFTKQFDFKIQGNSDMLGLKINVKSVCFCCAKFFPSASSRQDLIWNKERKPMRFECKKNTANILLHNCDCRFCIENTVQEIVVKGEFSCDAQCARHKDFNEIGKEMKSGTIYLMRTEMAFELRYALCNAEAEKSGRQQRKFQLRDFLLKILNPNTVYGQEISQNKLKVLIDKSQV